MSVQDILRDIRTCYNESTHLFTFNKSNLPFNIGPMVENLGLNDLIIECIPENVKPHYPLDSVIIKGEISWGNNLCDIIVNIKDFSAYCEISLKDNSVKLLNNLWTLHPTQICTLDSMEIHNSTLSYLFCIWIKDIKISIWDKGSPQISANVSFKDSTLKGVFPQYLQFDFEKEYRVVGTIERPLNKDQAYFLLRTDIFVPSVKMPEFLTFGGKLTPVGALLYIENGVPDTAALKNYIISETQTVQLVSSVYYGYTFLTPGGKIYGMHYPVFLDNGISRFFYSDGIAISNFGKPLDTDLFVSVGILGHNEFDFFKIIYNTLYEFNPFLKVKGYDRMNISVEFIIYNEGYVIEEMFFEVDYDATRTIMGYIYNREDNINNYSFPAEYITVFGSLFSENFNLNKFAEPASFLPENAYVNIDPSTYNIAVETYYAIGEAYEEPNKRLSDYSSAFGEIEGMGVNEAGKEWQNDSGLSVKRFRGRGNLAVMAVQLELTVDTSRVLKFSIGEFDVTVREITGYLNYSPENTGVGLSGVLELGFTDAAAFQIFLGAYYENAAGKSYWAFEAGLKEGEIPLSAIINKITGWNIPVELTVTDLLIKYASVGTYHFKCGISTKFSLFNNKFTINVGGEIVKSTVEAPPEITLTGELLIHSFKFGALIRLREGTDPSYIFTLVYDKMMVTARNENNNVLRITLKNISIGSLLTAFMDVVRPNVKFRLQKPWDILNRIGFESLDILFDLDTKNITVSMSINIDLLIIRIHSVGFTYLRASETEEAQFRLRVEYNTILGGELLESAPQVYDWDTFSESAPGLISEESKKKFKLHYFGIGRNINLGVEEMENGELSKILEKCKSNLSPSSTLPSGKYSGKHGWFIGSRFTLLEAFDVCVIFYDPVIYGLQVKVLNDNVIPLKGLDLTIYYRKITESIGLFYGNLVLPDRIRRMEFGAVSVTLPRIEAWIYTNGNFKIDFGFPKNGDFSNSLSLTYGIYTGKGGFYFGYLNGDTSSEVPKTIRGYFDPVIELGLGLYVGVGKQFNCGVLSLSASLSITAIFTGVFAKFNGNNNETAVYYKCKGTLILAGELKGMVDFFIIQVSFRIYAKISVSALLESGEPTVVEFEAHLSVSASVKILFIRINFSFSFTYRSEFTLGSRENRPWKLAAVSYKMPDYKINWTLASLTANNNKISINAVITPYFSKDGIKTNWSDNSAMSVTDNSQNKIAFLMTVGTHEFTEFYKLFAKRAFDSVERGDKTTITREQLAYLLDSLSDPGYTGFSIDEILLFLSLNVTVSINESAFSISKRDRITQESEGVPIPFFPVFAVDWISNNNSRFNGLKSYDWTNEDTAVDFFREYILLITRACVEKALSYAESLEGTEVAAIDEIMSYLSAQSGNIRGMASRMMLHGVRRNGRPLYDEIKQQFNGVSPGGRTPDFIIHQLKLTKNPGILWVTQDEITVSIAEGDLIYPAEPLNFEFIKRPGPIPAYCAEDTVIGLSDVQTVYLNDAGQFYLWKPQGDVQGLTGLMINKWQISRKEKSQEGLKYKRTALLELGARRLKYEDNILSIISATEETRHILNRFEKSGDRVSEVLILFSKEIKKSDESKPKGAFFYEEGRNKATYLIQQNLSEITTAPVYLDKASDEAERFCIELESDKTAFFKSLHRMLKIGGEGHYLQIGGEKLDSELFDDEGDITIYFMLTFGGEGSDSGPDYSNRLCLYEFVDTEYELPVIVNTGRKTFAPTLPPGKTGFELCLKSPGDECPPFNLLYYKIGNYVSSPISMQDNPEAPDNGLYYSNVIDIAEILGSQNPYIGIVPENYSRYGEKRLNALDISFFFADIVGNAISHSYIPKEPIYLAYYDNLYSIMEIPLTQVSYVISPSKETGKFTLNIKVTCSEQKDERISRENIDTIYYQVSAPDVVLGAEVQIGDYTVKREFSDLQKSGFEKYLSDLRQYAEDMGSYREGKKPEDFLAEFIFQAPAKSEVLMVSKLSVQIITERDAFYVQKGNELPNVQKAVAQIPAHSDIDFVCGQFEEAFPYARLISGEGLYGAFFPEKLISIAPPETDKLFFALKPVSLKLISRADMELSTVESRLMATGETEKVSYYDIDIEKWIGSFLAFYERVLEAGNIGSYLKSEGADLVLQNLLSLKKELSCEIVERMESVFYNSGAVTYINTAKEVLRDLLLKNLHKGYKAAGVVCYDQTDKLISDTYALSGAFSGTGAVLSGKVEYKQDKDGNQKAQIGFAVTPEAIMESNTFSMEKLRYTFTHLEDKKEGNWYRFVRPFQVIKGYIDVNFNYYDEGAKDSEPVLLPIPLREYPGVPAVKVQNAADSTERLENLKWDYDFDISASLCAQDKVNVLIHGEDKPVNQFRARGNMYKDLFELLAQFMFNIDEYTEMLFGEGEKNVEVTGVLKDFLELSTQIKNAWNIVFTKNWLVYGFSFAVKFNDKHYVSEIIFKEDTYKLPPYLDYPVLTVTDENGDLVNIEMDMETKTYYIPGDTVHITADKTAYYGFVFKNIPLYKCAGLRAEVYLRRNEEFPVRKIGKNPDVNGDFIYETQVLGFDKLIYPEIFFKAEGDKKLWNTEEAKKILQGFIVPDSMDNLTNSDLDTELTFKLGQKIAGNKAVYKPVYKYVRHKLSEQSIEMFLKWVTDFAQEKRLFSQGKYFVRFNVTQYADSGDITPMLVCVDCDEFEL